MGGPPPERRERMKLEDMKVGAFVKCTKPEWDCYNNIFEITKKYPDGKWENGKWELETIKCARGALKETLKGVQYKTVVTQKALQHNFKLDKEHTAKRELKIVFRADGTTFIGDGTVCENVSLYHEDKYDEFVGAVEALAKFYDRKSPFEEIEELKDVARAADNPIEATEVSDEWSTVEKEEEPQPHSPVDDMDLTPPLEAGCLIKLKNPYTDKLKGKWFKVTYIGDDTAVIPVFLKPNKMSHEAFFKEDCEVVKERYRNIWDSKLKYQFGDRVVLTQTGFNVKRKSYGTIIDWRKSFNETYYIVHWDDEDARFLECKEEVIPEYCLLPVRYE